MTQLVRCTSDLMQQILASADVHLFSFYVGGGVGTVGEGGKRGLLVAVTFIIDKSTMWAGFRRSSDIASCCLLMSKVKVLSLRLTTL